jgi:hypothetical protein
MIIQINIILKNMIKKNIKGKYLSSTSTTSLLFLHILCSLFLSLNCQF